MGTLLRCRGLIAGLVVLLIAAIGNGPEQAAAQSAVERISLTARTDGQGYVMRVHTSDRVSAYSEPRRMEDRELEWILFNTRLSPSYQGVDAEGPVEAFTVEPKGDHLVLRLTLSRDAEVETAAYRDRGSSDLLLGLASSSDGPPTDEPATPSASTDPPVTPASASGPSAAENRSSSAGDRWRFDTVVIDAGHGGKDPGAQAYGVREKDVVLGIARKLGGYIEERLEGVRVVYTRDDDRFVTLRDRGHMANEAGGKLFISIHANSARNRAAQGTETYFLGTHKSSEARRVMERENSVIRLEENPEQYEDFSDGVMQTLAQSAYMRQSERLGGLVQQQFEERARRKNRGVRQAGFLVLWAASMPAILVETGFLTNREEARFLASDRGQDYIASGIFRAVREFKEEYEKGLHLTLR